MKKFWILICCIISILLLIILIDIIRVAWCSEPYFAISSNCEYTESWSTYTEKWIWCKYIENSWNWENTMWIMSYIFWIKSCDIPSWKESHCMKEESTLKEEWTDIDNLWDTITNEEYITVFSWVTTWENFTNNRTLNKTEKDWKLYYEYKIDYSWDDILLHPHSMEIWFYSESELIKELPYEDDWNAIFFKSSWFVFSPFDSQFQFVDFWTLALDNDIRCLKSWPSIKFPIWSWDFLDRIYNNWTKKIYSYENRTNHEVWWKPGNFMYPDWIPEQAFENCVIEFDYPDNYNLSFSLWEWLKDSVIAHSKEKWENTHCWWWIKNSYQLITWDIICEISLWDWAIFDYFNVN